MEPTLTEEEYNILKKINIGCVTIVHTPHLSLVDQLITPLLSSNVEEYIEEYIEENVEVILNKESKNNILKKDLLSFISCYILSMLLVNAIIFMLE